MTVTAPVTGTLTYTYDALGRRASLLYPGETTPVTYAYTERGQLDTVTDWLSNVTDYGYDTAGRLTSIDYPNGVDATLGYDDGNRLTSIDYVNGLTTLEAIDYTLNAAGIRTQMVDSTGTTIWGYDNLYRLTSVDYPTGNDVGYTYDKVGNRETMTVGTTVTDYTYNTLSQLTAIDETDDGTDDITYGYDTFGNLTSKVAGGVTTTYAWDALDRLTSVTSSGSTVASYIYNGDGLRARKTVGATTTDYTWDPMGLGTVINVDDGTVDDSYLWGLGLIGRIDGSGAETYAHSDGLGSIRSISDSTGAEVGTREYDAFGATRASTGITYAFGFTGEQVDNETGFVYLRARYLDPGTGRFISKDPIGLAGGDINLYSYAHAAPTFLTDPSGYAAGLLFVAGLAAFAGGVTNAGLYWTSTDNPTWQGALAAFVKGAIAAATGVLVALGVTFLLPTGLASTLIAGAVGGAFEGFVSALLDWEILNRDMLISIFTSAGLGGLIPCNSELLFPLKRGGQLPKVKWMLSPGKWTRDHVVFWKRELASAFQTYFIGGPVQLAVDIWTSPSPFAYVPYIGGYGGSGGGFNH